MGMATSMGASGPPSENLREIIFTYNWDTTVEGIPMPYVLSLWKIQRRSPLARFHRPIVTLALLTVVVANLAVEVSFYLNIFGLLALPVANLADENDSLTAGNATAPVEEMEFPMTHNGGEGRWERCRGWR
ncbi:hypothetical protein BZA05DRAFT_471468 [Tricharina praecox]|uniref:uncharacterized protein n=1 Tax=Tricharina praecox TaxID=43433 RepID=UPI00221EA174|nr:uncharacterized protein BZA05DRAFT_471468 [Tricharina praecox]KAI5856380.1 hypothetical protein BZA05DRAFT_471468 [Tricharina praecox]